MISAFSYYRLGLLMREFRPDVLVNQFAVLDEIEFQNRAWRKVTVEHKPGEPVVVPALPSLPIPETLRPIWKSSLGKITDQLIELQMEAAYATAVRMAESLDDPACPLSYLHDEMKDLRLRVFDELNYRTCFYVWRDEEKLYKADKLFGETVATNFPSAAFDIEEAGKCLALGRATACVFHLMRVMEVGLRALAKSLNDPRINPANNPSWHNILKKGDDELQKVVAQRAPEWRSDDQFFSQAQANLRAVQFAWRNPTMHIDVTYTPETAKDVMQCVGGFMRHLSTKLNG
jgi:hypothetical protein